MQRDPLRLGSSTSGLTRPLDEETRKLLTQSSSFSAEESEMLRSTLKSYGELIAQSQIRSIEYFTTLPMLELGLKHPMIDLLNNTGDNCEVWSVHAPFGGVDLASPDEAERLKSVADTKRAADIANGLGAKVLTVHPGLELPNMEPRSARVEASGKSIAEVADHCSAMGIRVAVEILPRRCIGNSLTELFAIADIAGKPNVGFCLDSNHSFPASALTDVVRKIGTRLVTLHISDHDDVDERHWLPMRGLIDWPAFIRSLREIGYTGPFMYEATLAYPDVTEAITALEESYRQLMASA